MRRKHRETLKVSAIVCQFLYTVQDKVNDLAADGVVSACEIVGDVLLSRDRTFGMTELSTWVSQYAHHSHPLTQNRRKTRVKDALVERVVFSINDHLTSENQVVHHIRVGIKISMRYRRDYLTSYNIESTIDHNCSSLKINDFMLSCTI